MANTELTLPVANNAEASLALRETWQNKIAGRRHIGGVALSNLQQPITIHSLSDVEETFDALRNAILADFRNKEEASAMLNHILELKKSALGEQPVVDGNPILDENDGKVPTTIDARAAIIADSKVQKLISERNTDKSHTRLVEAWPVFKEAYTQGFRNGVQLGYIPESAGNRLDAAFSKTSVRMIDSAVLDIHGSMTAYYNNDHDEIGVRHIPEETSGTIIEDLTHEFTHQISGGTFFKPKANSAQYHRPRVGLSTELRPEVYTKTGLNEAVTHHVTLGILTGDFETLDPDRRSDNDPTYYEYRKVLAEFIGRSQGIIHTKTVTNALFEDTGADGGLKMRRQLIRETRQAYGSGALKKLEKLMSLTGIVGIDRYYEVIFSRIHPPILGEDGSIQKKGFIDIENLQSFYDLLESEQ